MTDSSTESTDRMAAADARVHCERLKASASFHPCYPRQPWFMDSEPANPQTREGRRQERRWKRSEETKHRGRKKCMGEFVKVRCLPPRELAKGSMAHLKSLEIRGLRLSHLLPTRAFANLGGPHPSLSSA